MEIVILNSSLYLLAPRIRDCFHKALQYAIDTQEITIYKDMRNDTTIIRTESQRVFDKIILRMEEDKMDSKLFFERLNEQSEEIKNERKKSFGQTILSFIKGRNS
jgi:LEA14-like dessication related protein